jgi:hypothetical protein
LTISEVSLISRAKKAVRAINPLTCFMKATSDDEDRLAQLRAAADLSFEPNIPPRDQTFGAARHFAHANITFEGET